MMKSTRVALAFLALAGATGATAVAQDMKGKRGDGMRGARLERLDADSSGDVTLEEFSAAANSRITGADADNDGRMTVEEIADEILRRRAERQARRLIDRFDTDGDGVLTTAEVESRQQKRFALLDRDDSGTIEADEMKRRGRHHRRMMRMMHDGMMGRGMMDHGMMDTDDATESEGGAGEDTEAE